MIGKLKIMQSEIKVNNLSKHLFWDVYPQKLDFLKYKRIIIHRVLDLGLISDW